MTWTHVLDHTKLLPYKCSWQGHVEANHFILILNTILTSQVNKVENAKITKTQ